MNSISGTLWLRILTAAIGHAAHLAARPRLAPFVADFESVVAQLRQVLSIPEGQDTLLDELRAQARGWDTEHDDGHRSFVRLLEACALRGTSTQRAAVAGALAALYPNGLGVVNLSFAEEVGATQVLAERSKAPDVQAGLAVVQTDVPGAATWIDRIVTAGQELGKSLDAIDERLALIAGTPKGGGANYIRALNASRRAWSYFLTTVNYELKAGVPEDDELRELLVGPYLRELDRLKAKKETPAEAEAPAEQLPV